MAYDGEVRISTSIDTDGLQKGVKDIDKSLRGIEDGIPNGSFEQAKKSMASIGEAAKAAARTALPALKNIGLAAGGIALAAGGAAVKLGKEVVQSFGELEQNLGGSEAVFGKYAESIQKTGEEAYKNLGASQSEYLATANKMGALFQGSGIEQRRSLELTEQAMQRAADMASVMGIDTQTALESIAGAAKGNFTMMDNLGVAMTETNLEAYALSKGMKLVWSEASQSEKAEIAMQMFFEKTQQYAGNFAKESEQTISGSFGLLKASVSSFIAGLGNENANMQNLAQNVVNSLSSVFQNVAPIIENLAQAIPGAIGGILPQVMELLPTLIETATSLFTSVLDALLAALPDIIPVVVAALTTITGALIENLPLIIDAAIQLITALVTGIGDSLPQLIPVAIEAIMTVVQGLIDNMPKMLDAGLKLILGLADGLLAALPKLIQQLPKIIAGIVNYLIKSIPQIIVAGVKLLVSLAKNLPQIIAEIVKAIPTIIVEIVKAVIGLVPELAKAGGDLLRGLWKGISDAGAWLWSKISGFFGGVLDRIKDFFGIASPSKVFARLGKFIDQGFIKGIESMSGAVNRTMSNVFGAFDFDRDFNIGFKVSKFPTFQLPDAQLVYTPYTPNISIPKLARGGIVDRATLALIGEKGREAVVPLENSAWMKPVLDRLDARSTDLQAEWQTIQRILLEMLVNMGVTVNFDSRDVTNAVVKRLYSDLQSGRLKLPV
jgi:hypothetical protein